MVIGKVAGAAFGVTVGPLITAMDKLKDTIRDTFDFADRAQKASLALGKTYEETGTSLGGTMQGLRGDINQRFAAGIAGMEAGLQGNTAGVAKLINQQMLTGTAYKQTAKAFASLEVGLNLSRDETNVLASNLVEIGDTWEISTDNLVKSLDALKDTFPAQKLAGMGKDMMEAIAQFQSELGGAAMTKPLNRIMNMIFDTSQEGYARLAALGMVNIREQLSASKGVSAKMKLMKEAFGTGSDRVKSFTVNADKLFLMIGAAERAFGKPSLDLTTIMDALGDRIAKGGNQAADFGDTLRTLKAEALVPFQEALTFAYPLLKDIVRVMSGIAVKVGESFKGWVQGLSGGEAVVKKVTLAMLYFAIIGLNAFDKMINKVKLLADEWLPKITEAFMGVNTAIHWGIVIPLEALKLIWNSLMIVIEGLAEVIVVVAQKLMEFANTLPFVSVDMAFIDALSEELSKATRERVDSIAGNVERMALTPAKSAELFKKSLKEANADPDLLGNKLLKQMRDNIANDSAESLLAVNNVLKNTEEINAKTPEISTTPEFLDETANMLGRSIEGILGVGRDTTAEEMLEELREANQQRAAAAITGGTSLSRSNPNSPP